MEDCLRFSEATGCGHRRNKLDTAPNPTIVAAGSSSMQGAGYSSIGITLVVDCQNSVGAISKVNLREP